MLVTVFMYVAFLVKRQKTHRRPSRVNPSSPRPAARYPPSIHSYAYLYGLHACKSKQNSY